MSIQEVQSGDAASGRDLRTGLYAKSSDRVRVPRAEVSPLLENIKARLYESWRDDEKALSRGARGVGRGCGEEGRFSTGWSGARVTDVGREKGWIVICWFGRWIRMDLCRSNPRFRTLGEMLTCVPLEICRRMTYPDLWLSEENAGGDHTGQKGEEGGRVGTRGGAHLRTRAGEGRTRSPV